MILRSVPSSWLAAEQHRLDCGPFTSGRIEARHKLSALHTEPLRNLTRGGMAGMYHVGMEKLRRVNDAQHGVPFLTSSDICLLDLSHQSFISKRQVQDNQDFLCPPGSTLITRSGTIGRLVYARPEMASMAISQDVLKVVPDSSRIPPGYLFSFLTTRFGIPLIVGGTFGSIIVHIEAENIASLPVPRLGPDVEGEAHSLVESAAASRSRASDMRAQAIGIAAAFTDWTVDDKTPDVSTVLAGALSRRMDAFHHSQKVRRARQSLIASASCQRIGAVATAVFEPNRGPRRKVDDLSFGVPFFSSSEVFALDPTADYSISRKRTPNLDSLLVSQVDLLVPRSGQIGGIIGRAVLPVANVCGNAASEHLIRIRCQTHEDACYLWAVLASEPGYWSLVGTAFGSSIPSLDCELISELSVPWISDSRRDEVVGLVQAALRLQNAAIESERRAKQLVEETIEETA